MVDTTAIELMYKCLTKENNLDKAQLKMFKEDPVWFIEFIYGVELMDYQKVLVRNMLKTDQIKIKRGRMK